MTTRIKALVEQYIEAHGCTGKAQLCMAVGKSENTLNRWLRTGFPTPQDAFNLLLAIGMKKHEALRLAREEALPAEAREPA